MLKDNHIHEYEKKIEFLLQINENLKQKLEGQKSGSIKHIVSKLDSLESLMGNDNYEISTLFNPDIFMRTEEGVELLNSVLSELSLVQPIIKEMLERNKELIKESVADTDSTKNLDSKIIPTLLNTQIKSLQKVLKLLNKQCKDKDTQTEKCVIAEDDSENIK